MANKDCFVCGEDNPHGLHIRFEQAGDTVVATYRCEERHAGWPGVQHGGITAALLDEAAGYIPHFLGLPAMTAKLDVSYVQPIRVGEVVRVVGKMLKRTRRVIEVESEIVDVHGTVKARASAKMFVLSEQQQVDLRLEDVL